jgi:hypothetical protein
MDLQNTLATKTATDAGAMSTEGQAQEKFYSQKEFDDAMAKTRAAVERKMQKTFSELGDLEELKAIKQQAESSRYEEQKNKGDFESILKDLASKKDAEIQKRDQIIAQYRVETPLVEIAAKYRAVAPEQVKALLRNQIKLSPDGEVEVVDNNGTTRYRDDGNPFGVEDLVKNFLDSNPHFVAAGPTTTQTKSSIGSNGISGQVDITKLDMSKPADRKVYAEWKSNQGR